MDAHLAEVDPFELLEELKKTQHGRDIPVIFMTTLEDADARVKVLEAGDDLIVKQVASAVGQGSISVNFVHKYLETV